MITDTSDAMKETRALLPEAIQAVGELPAEDGPLSLDDCYLYAIGLEPVNANYQFALFAALFDRFRRKV